MIDSGAFTLFNSTNGKMGWLNIDNYCKFLDTFGQFSEKYVMLDVINNHEASKDNYELMLKRDLNPMFVFTTYDNDYTYLKQAVARNPHICVAGGVTSYRQWMQKRYQDVYKNTQALMHGLGFVKFPDMLQLPLHSVDSSSWVQASQVFGILRYFDEGMKGPRYIDVLKRKVALPEQIKQLLDKFKVTPKIALLSYSNFGSSPGPDSEKMAKAVDILHENYPSLVVDGELQANFALNNELMMEKFSFSQLANKQVNTLIFPNLSSGNIAYKLLQQMTEGDAIGPVLVGLKKSVHVMQMGSSVREIVNMVKIAVVDAQNK